MGDFIRDDALEGSEVGVEDDLLVVDGHGSVGSGMRLTWAVVSVENTRMVMSLRRSRIFVGFCSGGDGCLGGVQRSKGIEAGDHLDGGAAARG